LKRLAALALAAHAVLGVAQPKSDWEIEVERRGWKESEYNLPAPPKPADVIEFFVSSATDFRFFVDPQSLSVGKDGVVRYTLLARSPSGAENVTFEGIRCSEGWLRVYAGRGRGWSERFGMAPDQPKSTRAGPTPSCAKFGPQRVPSSICRRGRRVAPCIDAAGLRAGWGRY
jgi:hypothetical protein